MTTISTKICRATLIGTQWLGANALLRSTLHLSLSIALLLGALGCGSGSPQPVESTAPPADAPPPPPPEPVHDGEGEKGSDDANLEPAERDKHVEDALREIDVAERSIEKSLDQRPQGKPPRLEPTPVPGERAGTGACDTACRALGSMERSATYVCRLAGNRDPRCLAAQDRVRAARVKVERAACSCPQPVSQRSNKERLDENDARGAAVVVGRFVGVHGIEARP